MIRDQLVVEICDLAMLERLQTDEPDIGQSRKTNSTEWRGQGTTAYPEKRGRLITWLYRKRPTGWEVNRGSLPKCSWCDHKNQCPAKDTICYTINAIAEATSASFVSLRQLHQFLKTHPLKTPLRPQILHLIFWMQFPINLLQPQSGISMLESMVEKLF